MLMILNDFLPGDLVEDDYTGEVWLVVATNFVGCSWFTDVHGARNVIFLRPDGIDTMWFGGPVTNRFRCRWTPTR